MNILALESSSHKLSVALSWDGGVIERSADLRNAGSQNMLPWVADALGEAGMNIADVEAIAFGAGPGGFVGLRLACAVAQGLAFGLGVPLLGVCTLEAMALVAGTRRVYACCDARMNEIYVAAYEVTNGVPEILISPSVHSPIAAPVPPGAGWLGAGDGFGAYGEILQQRLGRSLDSVVPSLWPTASAVARLALPRLQRGEGHDPSFALPLYVRDKVALTTFERLARGGVR